MTGERTQYGTHPARAVDSAAATKDLSGPELGPWHLICGFRLRLVIVVKPTKDRSTPDPAVYRLGDRCSRERESQLQRAMWPLRVVVRGIRSKHRPQVPFAEDQHPIGQLGPHHYHEALGEAFRPRTRGGILTTAMPDPPVPRRTRPRTVPPDPGRGTGTARCANRGPSRGCGPAGWSTVRRGWPVTPKTCR
jgi:hypothetical protein